MVAHYVRDVGVACSSHVIPTKVIFIEWGCGFPQLHFFLEVLSPFRAQTTEVSGTDVNTVGNDVFPKETLAKNQVDMHIEKGRWLV